MIALFLLLQTLFAQAPTDSGFKDFTCGGGVQGNHCELQFYFQNCHSRMELVWPKLFMQGKKNWDKQRANWCTVRFYGPSGLVRERKLARQKCDRVLDAFADALRVHPEKPWQEGVCSLTSPDDGLIVAKQAPAFQNAKSVLLPGAGRCELQAGSKIRLKCPYLDDRVQQWLEEFSTLTGIPVTFSK